MQWGTAAHVGRAPAQPVLAWAGEGIWRGPSGHLQPLLLARPESLHRSIQIPSSPCLHPTSSAPDLLLGPQLVNTFSSGGIHRS